MTDELIETTLQRYRAVAPDAVLRERVLAAVAGPATVALGPWDWSLAAAAALLLLAWVATEPKTRTVTADDAAWRMDVEQLAAAMGNDPAARQLAPLLVKPLVPFDPSQGPGEQP